MEYRIKEALKAKGLTSKELAANIGITENGLSLAMKRGFTISRLEQIANALGCRVADLLQEEQPQERPFVTCPHCGKRIYLKAETE